MRTKINRAHTAPAPPTAGKADASADTTRRASWLNAVTTEPTRFDEKIGGELRAYSFRNTRILLIGFSPEHLRDIRQRLFSIGVAATVCYSDLRQIHDVSCIVWSHTYVLVDLDAFNDVETAVEALIAIRLQVPDPIVVLLSEMVGRDDFGGDRFRICDATLKLPISTSRLIDGLELAFHNHERAFRHLIAND